MLIYLILISLSLHDAYAVICRCYNCFGIHLHVLRAQWTKTYDLLIDAAIWKGEWSRGVGLLKQVVDLGFPVDTEKRRRLLQDMQDFYVGRDEVLGILAEVAPLEPKLDVLKEAPKSQQWLATSANSSIAATPEQLCVQLLALKGGIYIYVIICIHTAEAVVSPPK